MILNDCYQPYEAEIIGRTQETPTVFTLRLRFTDSERHEQFRFSPGEFNMLYLYGIGEVAISIISDPFNTDAFDHTIRAVGRVTKAISQLRVGDKIGVRGAYGKGWPLEEAKGKNVTIVSGGIGCAPVVSVINYITRRRNQYGHLKVFQGIKHSSDMIFHHYFSRWEKIPDTEVIVSADKSESGWSWSTGRIVDTIKRSKLNPDNNVVMMCGPEVMMELVIDELQQRKFNENQIYLSMERNMECGIGHCGHCQIGEFFVCKDGPIFSYSKLKHLFNQPGF